MEMSFNPNIFKYPAVQYIPLAIKTLERDLNWQQTGRLKVKVWQEQVGYNNDLNVLQIPRPPATPDFMTQVAVLVVGGQVKDVKYRGYTVYLVGEDTPRGYHLFNLPRHYFYKQRLHFAFFVHSGERLAWDNITL